MFHLRSDFTKFIRKFIFFWFVDLFLLVIHVLLLEICKFRCSVFRVIYQILNKHTLQLPVAAQRVWLRMHYSAINHVCSRYGGCHDISHWYPHESHSCSSRCQGCFIYVSLSFYQWFWGQGRVGNKPGWPPVSRSPLLLGKCYSQKVIFVLQQTRRFPVWNSDVILV